jgi:hypothetical protein
MASASWNMRAFYDREIGAAVVDFRRLQVRGFPRPRMLLGGPAREAGAPAPLAPERRLNATPSGFREFSLVDAPIEA